jgi:DnaK suppressor protein
MSLPSPAKLSPGQIFRYARELRRDRDRWVRPPGALFSVADRAEVTDTKDGATQELLDDTSNAQIARLTGNLAQIDAALERIESGSYGTCLSCSGPIGEARLDVEPSAARCRACQEAQEAKQSAASGREGP